MTISKTVVICSSANFYKHAVEIAEELEALGIRTVLPESANKMRKLNNFDVKVSRVWLEDPSKFSEKTRLMREHFKEIENSDVLLVINDDKNGIEGYIGANVLIEMGVGFYLKKPIFVLNPVSKNLPYYEEVEAMNCIIINRDLGKIKI